MKFAHMADAHIGSWREPKLRDASLNAFIEAVDISLEKNVDFILISGDLFNTSLPAIDKLKEVVKKLNQVKEKGISVYITPGSHDFSPSGKTMLDVLEHAGLLKNVVKGRVINNLLMLDFIVDKKTGAKITGMLGKKGMLEKSYYEALDREALESEPGFKIFMFHTALTELKPEDLSEMESSPISLLPKGFDYYAGGHVHIVAQKTLEGYGLITYPGPLFPNSFKELEELKSGGFFIWDERAVSYHSIPLFNVISANIECQHKSPLGVRQELIKHAEQILSEIKSYAAHAIGSQKPTIVLLRFVGMMASGKISEIEMNDIFDRLYDNGVYYIMKNTHKLTTKEYEEVKISIEKSNDVEDALITEHMGEHAKHNLCFVGGGNRVGDNSPTDDNTSKEKAFEDGKTLIKEIIHALDLEKQEGERVVDFEQRVKDNVSRIVKFS